MDKKVNKNLSNYARILRSKTSTSEERKRAAAMLGARGGTRSQNNINSKTNLEKKSKNDIIS